MPKIKLLLISGIYFLRRMDYLTNPKVVLSANLADQHPIIQVDAKQVTNI
jgi:hypothetical protein